MGIFFHKDNYNQLNNNLQSDEYKIKNVYSLPDGTLQFNFKYYKEEYDNVTSAIEKFKNHLKIESPYELEAIVFKLKITIESITNDELKGIVNNLIELAEKDVNDFYNFLKQIYDNVKNMYISNQESIIGWLNKNKLEATDMGEEKKKEDELMRKFNEDNGNFNKFEDVFKEINKIVHFFKFTNENILMDLEGINKFYEENTEMIEQMIKVDGKSKFRSFLNIVEQLKTFFEGKIELMAKFTVVIQKMNVLYMKIFNEINGEKDAVQIMNEINDYYLIMIKHRFIRHIEEKVKILRNKKEINSDDKFLID